MMKRKVPKMLWDYGLIWVCETSNMTVSSSSYTNGRRALEIITGEIPDISEFTEFGFYDWVVYRANAGLGDFSIGRWLGVSHKVGQLMSYWILTDTGKVISCTTGQRLTNLEQKTREWISRMDEYDENIERPIINIKDIGLPMDSVPQWNLLSVDEDDESFIQLYQNIANNNLSPKKMI